MQIIDLLHLFSCLDRVWFVNMVRQLNVQEVLSIFYSTLTICMSKKSRPNLYSNLLNRIDQDFLDIFYKNMDKTSWTDSIVRLHH